MSHHDSGFSTFLLFIGRVFMSSIFILAGTVKIIDFHQTASLVTSMSVPMGQLALVIAIILELGGGLLLFFGWYTRFGALLLLIFVLLATYFFHSFWEYEGAAQVGNVYHFMKNLFIFGGLFYVLAHGPGKFSLDRGWRKLEF